MGPTPDGYKHPPRGAAAQGLAPQGKSPCQASASASGPGPLRSGLVVGISLGRQRSRTAPGQCFRKLRPGAVFEPQRCPRRQADGQGLAS